MISVQHGSQIRPEVFSGSTTLITKCIILGIVRMDRTRLSLVMSPNNVHVFLPFFSSIRLDGTPRRVTKGCRPGHSKGYC